jgi:hypothetical protein
MKAWAAGHKLDTAAMQPSAGPFIVTLICSIPAAFVMSWLIQRLGIKDGMGGVRLAVIVWLGFALTAIWPHYAFPGLPFSLVAIDAGNAPWQC